MMIYSGYSFLWTTIIFSCIYGVAISKSVKIGVLSDPADDPRQHSLRFWQFSSISPDVTFEPAVTRLPWWSTLEVNKAVCNFARIGAKAVIAPSLRSNWLFPLYKGYAGALGLLALGPQNILPDTARATAALIDLYRWQSFAFIYDTDSGADHLSRVLRHLDATPTIEAFFRANDAHDAVRFVRTLPLNATRVLLATSEGTADEIIADLPSNIYFEGILIQPVAYVEKTRSIGFHKLTKFEMIGSNKFSAVAEFEHRWHTLSNQTQLQDRKSLPDSAIICHDMIRVVAALMTQGVIPDYEPPMEKDCSNYTAVTSPLSFSKMPPVEGFTGLIQFNDDGKRTNFNLTIIEATRIALKKLGQWSDGKGLELLPGQQPPPPSSAPLQDLPPIKVTSILNAPFLMRGQGDHFEGFVADMVDQMSNVLGRRFVINLVKDGFYGRLLDNGQWTGMVGELVREEADVAIADLTKTEHRGMVVQFGTKFMSLGLSVLMYKPANAEKEPTTPVIGPWSLWLAGLVGAGLLSSAVGYGLSKFLGAPDRVRALETKGTDNLSPCGSCWFTVGTLLRRDIGIYPRSFGHRLWSIMWGIFSFLLMAAYISSLTADLIHRRSAVTTTHSRKTSQEVLSDLLEKGAPAIGTVRGGSTFQFFTGSGMGLYREFGDYLKRRPEVMSRNGDEGAQRVRDSKGRYAFITESLAGEFYANQEPCDVILSSGSLNTRTYAIAMPKKSPLRDELDHAVLTLLENGVMRELYEKWWHNYTAICEDPNMDILATIYQNSVTLWEVSGVFFFLIGSAVVSVAAALTEHFVIKRRSVSLE